ncbi:cytochrome b5 domain-containing protein [Candidatus Planktophila lacus]|uniref:cytochrome b5 domain-containing protein n=1 Tax=Candidatus Planktophila lacus TaxID=1884913 RepID=UPI001CBE750C|nr:cytochrome b5-like heme/steroid binding domain-containing protein [Candidatus Planktophila lacus]
MKIYAIATGATVALALVVAPSASAAAKEGAACKKAGQSSTVSGRKFTCVKKGSKLVWNKGVVVKSAPTASATAAASAAPAAPAMSATPMASKSAEPSKSAAPASTGYTMERVKANGTSSSCWTVINGYVYDLTKWIGSHPGGSGAITSLCGTDGTSEFLAMHRGQGKPEARLSGYALGKLEK